MPNRDRVYDMAKEAGLDWHSGFILGGDVNRYEELAALVRADALEEAEQVAKLHAAEWQNKPVPLLGYVAVLDDCAAAIRKLKGEAALKGDV